MVAVVHGKIEGVESQLLLTKIKTLLSKVSVKTWIIGGAVFAVVLSYSLIFFIPKSVQFSYENATCVSQLTLAPSIQKTNSEHFDTTFEDPLRIGNVTLLTTKVCLEPKDAPSAGSYTASIAPYGGFVASKQLSVEVPATPEVKTSDIVGKEISTAQPLTVKLSTADTLHEYILKIAEGSTKCRQADAKISCDVAPLNLTQGATYTAALHQTYRDSDKKLVEGEVKTLLPITVTDATIKDGQTIYDAPTEATFTFDRPVTEADVVLTKVSEPAETVAVTKEMTGQTLKVKFAALPRESQYRLDLKQVVADNGSSLAAPMATNFTMSGGPKVSSVSVGANSVSRTAKIIVTFDQPLDQSVDVAKLARVEGIPGTVKRHSDTQLAFAIEGGDCTAFRLVVDKGVKSGSNGTESKEGWAFNSRTICGTSWVIGTSVKGRAIVAHSFGSGSKVILFTGGIHGSEPSSTTTMQAWVDYLKAYGDIIPADKRVVVVPNTNPDGIAAGSRYNANNVNLGRNFPTKNWNASIETASGVLATGGGTSAGSEPEAAALIALTRQLKPRLEISYHAQGKLVGANKFGDSVAIGNIYASTVGYKTMYYNAEDVMGYAMTGEYEDWMGEEMNIPAILIELPSHSGNYLNAQMAALKKMLAV